MITEFKGEWRWLSNFTPVTVVIDGIKFPSVEHGFVAMKTLDTTTRFMVSQIETPGKAKRFGRKIELRPDWEEIKIGVMEELLRQKFMQEPFKSQLIKTFPQQIQEGNRWGDTFWGVDLRTGKGRNELGKLLMKIRGELVVV